MIKRAVSVQELLSKKFKTMQFDGQYKASIGIPEMSGVWIVWGQSGNGKTRFLLDMCKYLTQFGKVAYNTLEEGARLSMQIAAKESGMMNVSKKFIFLNREPMEELYERLSKPKSPDIIVIDSWQYTGLAKKGYIQMKERFTNKLFIIVSHADGKLPEGRTCKSIRYDADVKIRIEGYKAFVVSRYGGNKDFIIWEQGAAEYWGTTN